MKTTISVKLKMPLFMDRHKLYIYIYNVSVLHNTVLKRGGPQKGKYFVHPMWLYEITYSIPLHPPSINICHRPQTVTGNFTHAKVDNINIGGCLRCSPKAVNVRIQVCVYTGRQLHSFSSVCASVTRSADKMPRRNTLFREFFR